MLNALYTIRFELLLTGVATGIGLLGLWHEYSAQRRIARMAQDFKDGGQGPYRHKQSVLDSRARRMCHE